jgi:hypothetical protein
MQLVTDVTTARVAQLARAWDFYDNFTLSDIPMSRVRAPLRAILLLLYPLPRGYTFLFLAALSLKQVFSLISTHLQLPAWR